ncbi:MAG TPA: type II toxin-antitoxin system prevent-host-death family antitoxin [Rhizomicrobium sp.]|jgi:prevent-host-death family protein
MSSVGAREANRSFSRILREAESGKTVTITRNGKPVARLEPALAKPTSGKAREKAISRMVELMEKGLDFGGRRFTRDEMHER